MGFNCPMCADFSAPSLNFLIGHIGRVHANDPNFKISCGVGDCQACYRSFRCFKDHLKKKYPYQLEKPEALPSGSLISSNCQLIAHIDMYTVLTYMYNISATTYRTNIAIISTEY